MAASSGAQGRDGPGGVSYESHFGFQRPPFSLAPDPRFLFDSLSLAAARDELASAPPRHEALVVVTGEIGTGKTTMCRALAAQRGSRTLVAVLAQPPVTREELLGAILHQFGVGSRVPEARQTTERELMDVLERFLASLDSLNAQASVVIDEAQHLRPDVFEQLRVLADLTFNGHHLVQIVLVGQPELEEMLARPDSKALAQRVTRRHRLGLLDSTEVGRFIALRVSVAGSSDRSHPTEGSSTEPFTSPAVRTVARLSRGVPRLVNVLCDRALESAFRRGSAAVSTADVIVAARQLDVPVPLSIHIRARRGVVAAAAAVLVAAVAGIAVVRQGQIAIVVPSTAARESKTASLSATTATLAPSPASPAPLAAAKPETLPEVDSTVVVVSAFKTLPRAMEVAGNLQQRALPAFARPTASGWQQVVLGPYATREEAVTARAELAAAGFPDSQLVQNAVSPAGGIESTGESKRVVSLSVPGRTSILIENMSGTNGETSAPTFQDGRFVVNLGSIEGSGWTRTFLAKESLPFVQEVAMTEMPRTGTAALLRATVTVRSGAIGSVRAAGGRVYLDFVQRPGENAF